MVIGRMMLIGIVIPLMVSMTGCDYFFLANIKDGITNQPLPGTKAIYSFSDGGHEQYAISNDEGGITFFVGATVWVDRPPLCGTLTVEKDGYQTWSTRFSGEWPELPYTIYLFPLSQNAKGSPGGQTGDKSKPQ
jgi:hypothetical protein